MDDTRIRYGLALLNCRNQRHPASTRS